MIMKVIPPAFKAVIAVFVITGCVFGQSPAWVIREESVKTEKAQVAVNLANSNVAKIRLINETTGKSETRSLADSKVVFLTVDLNIGKNMFTILGYNPTDGVETAYVGNFSVERIGPQASNTSQDQPKPGSENGNGNGKEDDDNSKETEDVRFVVGIEQSGASSADSKQSPFVDLFINKKIHANPRHRIWGNVRIGTSPIQSIASLSSFTTGSFATNFIGTENKEVNDLVQAFDVTAGYEFEFKKADRSKPKTTGQAVSFIIGGGITNTLSSNKSALFYNVPMVDGDKGEMIDPRFLKAFPEAEGKEIVAFVSPERDRFFRQYFAGVRFKSFNGSGRFPAMLDVTLGQNEAITGIMRGVIFRADGSMPLKIKGTDYLYLFGGAQLRLGRSRTSPLPEFFLSPVTSGVDLTSENTFVVAADRSPFLRSNRDTYRIGIGVDLFRLFNKDDEDGENGEEKKKDQQ